MINILLALLLCPILLPQGLWVRRTTPALPEPEGARQGIIGSGTELKLLVLGDSAGAGVGVDHQDKALLGQLTRSLSREFRVSYFLHAKTSATTCSTLSSLDKLPEQVFDVVLVSLGVNDVTSGVSRAEWLTQQSALRSQLRSRFQCKLIVLTEVPPMHLFPALPQPLRWYLGRIVAQFNHSLDLSSRKDPSVRILKLNMDSDVELMASDGFHPGPAVYAWWGQTAAELITCELKK